VTSTERHCTMTSHCYPPAQQNVEKKAILVNIKVALAHQPTSLIRCLNPSAIFLRHNSNYRKRKGL